MNYIIEITKKGSASDDIFTQFVENRGLGVLTTDDQSQPIIFFAERSHGIPQPLNHSDIESIYICERGADLKTYSNQTTPDGDGFGGRSAVGVSEQDYRQIRDIFLPLGIRVSAKIK